ncbi:hypothetical protein Tco_0722585 [Tanacetum coccineum]
MSTSSSTQAVSSDVAELKDMVRALILDRKNQTPSFRPLKAVEQTAAANFNQAKSEYIYLRGLKSNSTLQFSSSSDPSCEIIKSISIEEITQSKQRNNFNQFRLSTSGSSTIR